jgi:DNA repair protein RadC
MRCPNCGHEQAANESSEPDFFRPWYIRGRNSVRQYVESLGEEANEWLLALYVDEYFQLLAVDTVGRGDVGSCGVSFRKIFKRGHALNAHGFLLVHNHPSGDPTPSRSDIEVTKRLHVTARNIEMPLIDHLIIGGDRMYSVLLCELYGEALSSRPWHAGAPYLTAVD